MDTNLAWSILFLMLFISILAIKLHNKNRDIIAGELKVAGGYETEASKCVESMNKSVIDKLTVLFRNAHAFDTDSDD
jgi:hypothetical protein